MGFKASHRMVGRIYRYILVVNSWKRVEVFSSQFGPNSNRGPSSFDIRHTFSGALTWTPQVLTTSKLFTALARGWSIENIVQVRTAPPVDVVFSSLSFNGELAAVRPDMIPGVPLLH